MTAHTIANTAVLATLSISRWSGRKFDKDASDELNISKHASKDAARVNKLLVSGQLLGPVNRHLSKVRAHFYANTLPWDDNGSRVLPANKLWDMQRYMQEAKVTLQELLRDVLRQYAHEVSNNCSRMGDLFNPNDYPSTGTIQSKYGIHMRVMPIPTEDDFRVSFTEEHARAIREQVQSDLADMTQNAVEHIWESMGEMLTTVRDRLRSSDGRFTSIFDNLNRMVDDLSALNVTCDPKIEELQRTAQKRLLALRDPKALKADDAGREQAASDIDDVLKQFDGMWS